MAGNILCAFFSLTYDPGKSKKCSDWKILIFSSILCWISKNPEQLLIFLGTDEKIQAVLLRSEAKMFHTLILGRYSEAWHLGYMVKVYRNFMEDCFEVPILLSQIFSWHKAMHVKLQQNDSLCNKNVSNQ